MSHIDLNGCSLIFFNNHIIVCWPVTASNWCFSYLYEKNVCYRPAVYYNSVCVFCYPCVSHTLLLKCLFSVVFCRQLFVLIDLYFYKNNKILKIIVIINGFLHWWINVCVNSGLLILGLWQQVSLTVHVSVQVMKCTKKQYGWTSASESLSYVTHSWLDVQQCLSFNVQMKWNNKHQGQCRDFGLHAGSACCVCLCVCV